MARSTAISVATALAALALAAPSTAAPLSATKASELVTVVSGPTGCPNGFGFSKAVDIHANPDLTNGAFAIPAGSVLIVTSWDWWGQMSGATLAQAFLQVTNGTNTQTLSVSSVPTEAATDRAGATVETPPGVVVKSGQTLCIRVPGSSAQVAVAHGFLARDR